MNDNDGLTIRPKTSVISEQFDPQHISEDIMAVSKTIDHSIWNILRKLNARGTASSIDIHGLQEQVGPALTTSHYFLNGQEEPQTFKDDQTLTENVLGIKNSCLRNRRSIDSHFVTTANEVNRLKSTIKALESSVSVALNANPKATENKIANDLKKLQKEVAEALASASSLTAGSAFNTLDLTNRLIEVEQAIQRLDKKATMMAKSLGALKNEQAKNSTEINQQSISAIHERVSKLESQSLEEPHSRNLFDDMASTRIDLLEREVSTIRKDSKLELADSDLNNWLKTKLKAFLESPEMTDRFRMEFKTFGNTLLVQPENISRAVREQLAKVNLNH